MDAVERQARDAFAFLERYPNSRIDVDDQRYLYKTFTYMLDQIAFEVNLDWYERTVDLHIVWTDDGVFPTRPYRVYEGRRVRMYFDEALAFAGDEGRAASVELLAKLRANAREKDPSVAMPKRIQLWADALRSSIADLPPYYEIMFPMENP
jgi:hypothetical protein